MDFSKRPTVTAPFASAPLARSRVLRKTLLSGCARVALLALPAIVPLGVVLAGSAQAQTVLLPSSNGAALDNPVYLGSTNFQVLAGTTITNSNSNYDITGTTTGAWTLTNAGTITGGYSLYLHGATTLINSGSLGGQYGALISSGVGVVTNTGTITGSSDALTLVVGGSVSNATNAQIIGGRYGIAIYSGRSTIVNAGTISGHNAGIYSVGGVFSNTAGAQITGATDGISAGSSDDGASTIVNAGTIASTAGVGIYLRGNSGVITNSGSGVISGATYGVRAVGTGVTVFNAGTIIGGNGTAVQFGGGTNSLLQLASTGSFSGLVDGGGAGELELTAATGTGALSGFGTSFINFNTIAVDPAATWAFDNTDTIGSGILLSNSGTITGGVTLSGIGIVSNQAGASIDGIYSQSNSVSINNAGVIGVNAAIGVDLTQGGSVSNASSGTITGSQFGVFLNGVTGAAGAVVNAGTIVATSGTGVYLDNGGFVSNLAGGLVSGGRYGVYGYNSATPGTIVNAGTITGGLAGVRFVDSVAETIMNTGTITGSQAGVFLNGAGASVVNSGTIAATGSLGAGVSLNNGGFVSNLAGGVVSGGGYGVDINASGAATTLINAGTITGGLIGVKFADSANDTIINTGTITGSGGTAVQFGTGNGLLVVGAGGVLNGIADGGGNSTVEFSAGGTLANLGVDSRYINFGTIGTGPGTTLTNTGSVGHTILLAGAGTALLNQQGAQLVASGNYDVVGTGGPVVVSNAGLISSSDTGIYLHGASSSITNSGTIIASQGILSEYGGFLSLSNSGTIQGTVNSSSSIISSDGGAFISNAASGSITGGRGIQISGSATILNDGSIAATYSNNTDAIIDRNTSHFSLSNQGVVTGTRYGVHVYSTIAATVSVTNSGTIVGGQSGVVLANGTFSNTVVNTGTILGNGTAGIGLYLNNQSGFLTPSNQVTNMGLIAATGTAGVGVAFTGSFANTLVNSGTIIGGSGTAVRFGVGNDALIVDAGSTFDGLVDGGGGSNLLEFATNTNLTVAGIGTHYINFQTVDAATGVKLTNNGSIGATIGLLGAGSTLYNAADGTITNGIFGSAAGVSVTNAGLITGTNSIEFNQGGTLTNSGTITSINAAVLISTNGANSATIVNSGAIAATVNGVQLSGSNITLTNQGSIVGTSGDGIYATNGRALVTNAAGGTISGATAGVAILTTGSAVVSNAGSITATGTNGVGILFAGNGASTVINDGTITGASGTAIRFAAGNDLLVLDPGASFGGQIVDGGAGNNTAEFTSNQTLGAVGVNLVNFGTLAGAAGVTLTNTGSFTGTVGLTGAGAVLDNQTGAVVTTNVAAAAAVYGSAAALTVTNAGTLSATNGNAGDGVLLTSGGFVQNTGTAALISGSGSGVSVSGDTGTIVNAGTITGTQNSGVALLSGGSVTNAATGVISGGDGILFHGTSTVTNAGVISGTSKGIYASDGAVTVTNSGTIIGTNSAGIYIATPGGTVTNSGSIGGARGIVAVGGAFLAVSNSGTIQTGPGSSSSVISSNGGGFISNSASGVISGVAGSSLGGAAVTVLNDGLIAATGGNAIDIDNASSVSLVNTGVITSSQYGVGVTNSANNTIANSGIITGATGVDLRSTTTTLTNQGTIQGTNGSGVFVGQGSAVVTNANGGVISGSAVGAYFKASAAGLIDNAGLITATGTSGVGVLFGDHYGIFGNTVINSGTIIGGSGTAIRFGAGNDLLVLQAGASFGGQVIDGGAGSNTAEFTTNQTLGNIGLNLVNFGTLAAGAGVTLTNTGSFTGTVGLAASGATFYNQPGATLQTSVSNAAAVSGSAANVTISNAGSIAGIGSAGVNLVAGGNITNAASGRITGYSGIYFGSRAGTSATGTIINAGYIGGTTGSGISLYSHAVAVVSNTGVISGGYAGIQAVGATIDLTNSGTIQGTMTGVSVNAGSAVVTNAGGAVISGNTYGVAFNAGSAGTINNAGLITATGTSGVGVLFGDHYGVFNNTVINSGTITGGSGTAIRFGAGNDLLVLQAGASFGGQVIDGGAGSNTAEFTANQTLGNTGLNLVNFATLAADAGVTLTNAGSVTGTIILTASGAALHNQSGAMLQSGGYGGVAVEGVTANVTVSNAGTIRATNGYGTAVFLTLGGLVSNSAGATIVGSGYGVFINSAATLINAGTVTGDYSGALVTAGGSVTNAASGRIVGQYSGISLAHGGSFTIVNAGYVGGQSSYGIGVRARATLDLTNSGAITGPTGVGLYNANSSVTNQGTILGVRGSGVYIQNGTAGVTNAGSGVISGSVAGVYSAAGAVGIVNNAGLITATGTSGVGVLFGDHYGVFNNTVINSGTITGGSGTAIHFGAGNDLLVLQAGASFGGQIVDGGAGHNTAEFTASQTLGNAGIDLINFGTIAADAGVVLTNSASLDGRIVLSGAGAGLYNQAGATLTNSANDRPVVYASGANATVTNAGTIITTSGNLFPVVSLAHGGLVSNSGLIAGYGTFGLGINFGQAGSVLNSGTILSAQGKAVGLYYSGSVTNTAGGLITGQTGVAIYNETGSVLNDGTIVGQTNGVVLNFLVGSISNTGTIAGGTNGIFLNAGLNTISNAVAGVISGGAAGVYSKGDGRGLFNNAGLIAATGTQGVGIVFSDHYAVSDNTVTNSGTITGGSGTAIRFGAGNDLLVVGAGGVFNGVVDGGAGINTVEFDANQAFNGTFGASFIDFRQAVAGTGVTLTNAGNFGTSVVLAGDGSAFVNQPGATLTASYRNGILGSGVGVTVSNAGTIIGNASYYAGVGLYGGGTVVNTGTITNAAQGGFGVILSGGGSVTNSGVIQANGTFGVGVLLDVQGGSVSNASTGLITGTNIGIDSHGTAAIYNAGTVSSTAPGYVGIVLHAGGTLASTGLIAADGAAVKVDGGIATITNRGLISATGTSGIGIQFSGGGQGTVDNFGTISGGSGTAVKFAGGTNELIIETGGVLTGLADGSSGQNTLVFEGGGTLSNAQIIGFDSTVFGSSTTIGSSSTVSNAGFTNGGSSTNDGTITNTVTVANGSTVTNNGVFNLTGYSNNAGSLTNSGTISTTGNGTFSNTGSFANSGTVSGDTTGLINSGTVINSGTISGGTTGVMVTSGGTLTNEAGGYIQGGTYGIVVGAGGSGTNAGTIVDNLTAGASLGVNATFDNTATGTIRGVTGVIFTGTGASLTNEGIITGTGGVAVDFQGGANTLTLDTGTVLTGSIEGEGSAGTIDLIGTGTLTNAINNFGAGSTLTIANTADWTASGTWTVANVTNSGTFQPGSPGNPLRLTGSFTQSSTGTLRVLLDDISNSGSELIVTGSAALAGAVAVVPSGQFLAPKTYTIVNATGPVTGTFGGGATVSSALLVPTLSYDAHDAFVTLAQVPVASPPASPPVVSPPASPPASPPVVSPPASPPVVSPPASPPASPPVVSPPASPPVVSPPASPPASPPVVSPPASPPVVSPPASPPASPPVVSPPASPPVVSPPASPPASPPVVSPPASPPVVSPPASPPVVSPPASPPASPPVVSPPASPPVVSPPASPPVVSPPAIVETSNQHAVAVAFDAGLAANPTGFATAIRGLDQLNAAGVTSSLDRLSGESHASLATTALQTGALFADQFIQQGVLTRLGASGSASGQSAMAAGGRQELARLDGGTDDPVANIDKPWGVWTSGYGQEGQLSGNGNSHRLDETIAGGSVGADYKLTPALRIGAGLGYGGTTFSLDDGGGRGQVDHTQVALYSSYTVGPVYIDGTVGFAYGDGTTRRNVSLPGLVGQAAGHTTDTQILGEIEAGYGLNLGAATLTPFAGLSFGTVDQDGFTETGAGALDLHVAKQSQSSVKSKLGTRLTADLPLGATILSTDVSIGWAHEFAPTSRGTVAAFTGAPGAGFQVAGAKLPGDSALVGFGVATAIFANTSIYVHYDGDLASGASSNAITAGFRWSW